MIVRCSVFLERKIRHPALVRTMLTNHLDVFENQCKKKSIYKDFFHVMNVQNSVEVKKKKKQKIICFLLAVFTKGS